MHPTRLADYECPTLHKLVRIKLRLRTPLRGLEDEGKPLKASIADCSGAIQCGVQKIGKDGVVKMDWFLCAHDGACGIDPTKPEM